MIDELIKWGIILAIVGAAGLWIREEWESRIADPLRAEGAAEQHAIDEPIATGYLARATTAEAEVNAQVVYASGLERKWRDAQDASALEGQQVARLKDENAKLSRAAAAKLPAEVAAQRVDGRAVCLLDGTCAAATTSDAETKSEAGAGGVAAGGAGLAPADPQAFDDASLAAVVDWGITCRTGYAAARKQVIGWINYFNSLFP